MECHPITSRLQMKLHILQLSCTMSSTCSVAVITKTLQARDGSAM